MPNAVHDIEALLRRFARLNDEGRHEELADLFLEDGSFTRPSGAGEAIVGRQAILAAFSARSKGPERHHLIADPEVEISGPSSAKASSATVLIVRHDDGGGLLSVGGFDDELEQVDGIWKFRSRRGFTAIAPVPFPAILHAIGGISLSRKGAA